MGRIPVVATARRPLSIRAGAVWRPPLLRADTAHLPARRRATRLSLRPTGGARRPPGSAVAAHDPLGRATSRRPLRRATAGPRIALRRARTPGIALRRARTPGIALRRARTPGIALRRAG